MKSIKYEGKAACSPAQLFRLINLVEYYPGFLSWCKEASDIVRNKNALKATFLIKKYGISFRCPFKYTLRSKNEIVVSLPSGGPFYEVSGLWRFQGSQNETQFSFELQLDHQNTWWINYVLIPILKNEVKNIIRMFEQKARTISISK